MTNIIAHRGFSAIAPENTFASFAPMQQYQLDWFETDVSITADGQLVLLHDDKLDRTTDHTGELTDLTFDDIVDADAGSWFGPDFAQTRLLTINDLVQIVEESHVNLHLELKGITGPNGTQLANELIQKLAPTLNYLNTLVDLYISSFNPVMLMKMHALAPDLKYAVLYDAGQFYPDWQLVADACNASYIHLDVSDATPENIATIHERGFGVNVYTVNDLNVVAELEANGVDGIFTDIADQLVPQKVDAIAI
ncbi:glycerophosphoryl diester phosphodiesterase [Weissella uvarum]|uniref:glycerophosphodiester phosphodiesterase family protein n=1 Tax=Weissella uvarum TaxID=1479233 RepID=UPI00195F4692|nr:glycerophosphodiester phosphodiesterase family protein [Weissella uvarum]MBM7616649.1 glycerophosphoryl diester phosphodiesterase [Weissella uvarum]MCM0594893.1 glycerophosphoryl diester phosphodiesterase [Weissella uvarum]